MLASRMAVKLADMYAGGHGWLFLYIWTSQVLRDDLVILLEPKTAKLMIGSWHRAVWNLQPVRSNPGRRGSLPTADCTNYMRKSFQSEVETKLFRICTSTRRP